MFTNLLPSSSILLSVSYRSFAESHYLKSFQKKYKGKQWEKTQNSIFEDLKRLRVTNNKTQRSSQIDELNHLNDYWLFKYDFRVAGTNESSKTSGNRIIGFIDNKFNKLEILIIYGKIDLRKNQSETAFIYETLKSNYPEICKLLCIAN